MLLGISPELICVFFLGGEFPNKKQTTQTFIEQQNVTGGQLVHLARGVIHYMRFPCQNKQNKTSPNRPSDSTPSPPRLAQSPQGAAPAVPWQSGLCAQKYLGLAYLCSPRASKMLQEHVDVVPRAQAPVAVQQGFPRIRKT